MAKKDPAVSSALRELVAGMAVKYTGNHYAGEMESEIKALCAALGEDYGPASAESERVKDMSEVKPPNKAVASKGK